MDARGWQEAKAYVSLDFKNPSEAADLLQELRTWTPHGGWSTNATRLFVALAEAAGVDRETE